MKKNIRFPQMREKLDWRSAKGYNRPDPYEKIVHTFICQRSRTACRSGNGLIGSGTHEKVSTILSEREAELEISQGIDYASNSSESRYIFLKLKKSGTGDLKRDISDQELMKKAVTFSNEREEGLQISQGDQFR